MFKEVLKIVPTIDSSDLNSMERNLGNRFANVAKKFGKGLIGAIAGGGLIGIAGTVLTKLFNPLKEVQESIERSLHAADDLQDQAVQFNTTPGELAKLQAFGKTKGLQASEVNNLVQKFQTAVAEATADPTKETSVRAFVGNTNTAQAFLTFAENLSKLSATDKNAAIRVQQEVFGERQIGKSSNFLQADFQGLSQKFAGVSVDQLNQGISKQAGLQEAVQTAEALRGLKDINDKSAVINQKIIDALEVQKQAALDVENARLKGAEGLIVLQSKADFLLAALETKALPALGQIVGQIEVAASYLGRIAGSPLMRRFGLGKGK